MENNKNISENLNNNENSGKLNKSYLDRSFTKFIETYLNYNKLKEKYDNLSKEYSKLSDEFDNYARTERRRIYKADTTWILTIIVTFVISIFVFFTFNSCDNYLIYNRDFKIISITQYGSDSKRYKLLNGDYIIIKNNSNIHYNVGDTIKFK